MYTLPSEDAELPAASGGHLGAPAAAAGVMVPRWLLPAMLFALLCIAAAGYLYYSQQEESITQVQYDKLAAVARLKVEAIQEWRRNALEDGPELASNPLVSAATGEIRSGRLTEATRSRLLDALLIAQSYGDYTDATLADLDGRILITTGNPDFGLSEGAKQGIGEAARARNPLLATDIYLCPDCGHPRLDVVAPVMFGDDLVGAVVLGIDPQRYLYPMIQEWPGSSPSAETLLVRREGDSVLYLNELRHQAGTALTLRFPLSRTDLPAVQAVLGREGMFSGKDYRGVDVLADLRGVPDTPWFLVTKVDASEALAELKYRAAVAGIFVVLLALLAGAGTALAFRQREARLLRVLFGAERKEREGLESFRTVLYSIGDAVIVTDEEGRVGQMNPEAERLTGWSEAEAIGRPLADVFRIVNEETRAPADDPVQRVLAEGTVVGLANHTILLSRDGVERPIADSAAPVRGEKGRTVGVVLVFRDRTADRAAQRALVAAKERAELYFETAGVAMVVLDMEGRVVSINRRGCSLLGYPREEIVGKDWFSSFLPPSIQSRMKALFLQAAANEPDTAYLENPVLCRDGRERMVAWHNATIRGEHGEVVGVVSSGEDVTERRRATEELLRSQLRLKSLVAILQHPTESVQELLQVAVEQAVRLTDSQIGGISYGYDEEKGTFAVSLRSRSAEESCSIPEPVRSQGSRVSGLLREAIRRRSPLVINDYLAPHPLKKGYPKGHPEIRRYMAVPVLRNGRVVAAVAVANKAAEYDQADVEQLTLLMDAVWNAVERLQEREEKDRLAEQLAQAQKMESVGMLAGGVAHDFNNMLGVIIGHADLALGMVGEDHPARLSLEEILKAAERSADLTRKLLAFARKQTIAPRVVDLNSLVGEMESMLRRLIREEIRLQWVPQPDLWPVWIDPTQVEQILVNLVVNARDAIAGTGTITIETANATLDEGYSRSHVGHPVPGEYVLLSVSDTGEGIPQEVIPHIFEPFFSTKPKGKGTGLGLSTVYGIVKQNKGHIYVYSERGVGTTFKIYLPRSYGEAKEEPVRAPVVRSISGTETILLVEDEESILRLAAGILEQQGYRVLAASTPDEAVEIASAHEGQIHLLITDVVMPGMNGQQLRERLEAVRPGIKTIFMSGYTANAIAHAGVLDEGVRFIQKPFAAGTLLSVVRAVLGHPPGGSA